MLSSIQPLKTEWVYRMAAGEVIDSWIAVVRELIDNALDANATRISIDLWLQHQRLQIADNGVGLSLADLHQATLPHTTSKIKSFDQLNELQTLGFRGEALHSIVQLGHLEICSRTSQDTTGWRVAYDDQGAVTQTTEIAIAPGTSITVSHLFSNWPSRQQTTTKPKHSLRTLQTMISDYALCHPTVTWQVRHNNRPWLNLAPSPKSKDILLQILRKLSPDDLTEQTLEIDLAPLQLPHQTAQLQLILGLPNRHHRPQSDWLRIAVNGRRVFINTDTYSNPWTLGPLEHSILNAFRQTLPRHRYPLCWVHLQVPSILVDWNRTASKSHIYLHHLEFWQTHLNTLISQALYLEPPNEAAPNTTAFQLLKTAEAKGQYFTEPSTTPLSTPINLSAQLPIGQDQDTQGLEQNTLKAIAQLHQTYIVAEHPNGLWLIEQHIAHERVLYEQLSQNWQIIELEPPLTLKNLTEQQIENLEKLNLEIEPFGQNLWVIRTAPQALAQRPDCIEALYELSQCTHLQPALVATACRSALRNGTALTLSQMQHLINQWQKTQHPRTCPHGRPIYLGLDEQSLARFFRRHWMVGKSHGI